MNRAREFLRRHAAAPPLAFLAILVALVLSLVLLVAVVAWVISGARQAITLAQSNAAALAKVQQGQQTELDKIGVLEGDLAGLRAQAGGTPGPGPAGSSTATSPARSQAAPAPRPAPQAAPPLPANSHGKGKAKGRAKD